MMEQLLGDLGGKPLAPGEFSWWDVGQVLRPCPSSITPRKYLVSTKGCDGSATGLSLWSLQPATCCLGHRPPFPQRGFPGSPRGWSHQSSLYSGTPRDSPGKQPLELAPGLLCVRECGFPSMHLSTESKIASGSTVA